jgi:hypothetical protein
MFYNAEGVELIAFSDPTHWFLREIVQHLRRCGTSFYIFPAFHAGLFKFKPFRLSAARCYFNLLIQDFLSNKFTIKKQAAMKFHRTFTQN